MGQNRPRILRYQPSEPEVPFRRSWRLSMGGFVFGIIVTIWVIPSPRSSLWPHRLVGRLMVMSVPLVCGGFGAFFLGRYRQPPPGRGLAASVHEDRLECPECEGTTWHAIRTFRDGDRTIECLDCHLLREPTRAVETTEDASLSESEGSEF